jgi:large subunit ribosomal protein L9
MEVILREEVSGLGKAGELVKVKDGFARNFLLPQKKAVVADSKNLKMIEHQKNIAETREKKLRKSSEELAKKLSGMSVTITRDSGAEEKIFGSVTARDIVEALKRDGVALDKRQIILKEPIKQIGAFDVEVKLHPEVTGMVKVLVVKK